MDFEADIRSHVMQALPCDPADQAILAAKATGELLALYLNWCSRFIPSQPRKPWVSRPLNGRMDKIDAGERLAIESIVRTLSAGGDLTPHLSDSVRFGFQAAKSGRGGRPRRHLDRMLNDWGVHHLHLSTEKGPDGFVTRTKPVLFVIVRPEDAYLLDVVEHGRDRLYAWTQRHILEIMATEWPDAGLMLTSNGLLPSDRDLTDDERLALRRNGYTVPFNYGGKVYMPRYGQSSSGIATRVSHQTNRILKHARQIETEIRERSGYHWSAIAGSGLNLPSDPSFQFVFFPDGGYGVWENDLRAAFRTSPRN